MMLADANGPAVDLTESPISSASATLNPTELPVASPTQTIETAEEITIPVQGTGVVQSNVSWLVVLIIVIALLGAVVTLYLRNRK